MNLNKASVLKIAAGATEDTAVLERNGPRVPAGVGQRLSAHPCPERALPERGTARAGENASCLIFKDLESISLKKKTQRGPAWLLAAARGEGEPGARAGEVGAGLGPL